MPKVQFDYSKLLGRIKEKCGSQREFSKALGISETSMSAKLTGRTFFTQQEIERSKKILDIEPGKVSSYFFTERV
jgi:hypothetical protein